MIDDPKDPLNPEEEQPKEPNQEPTGENLNEPAPEFDPEADYLEEADYEEEYDEDEYEEYEEEYDEEEAKLEAENEESLRKLQEALEELEAMIAMLPKDVRVFEMPIPEQTLFAFREVLGAAIDDDAPLGPENPYQYFEDFVPTQSEEETKQAIVYIALEGDVEAYRFLQKLETVIDPALRDWTRAALMQCKMYLENSLRDEPILLLAAGMGGKDHRIRYLCYLSEFEPLPAGESRFVAQELETYLLKEDAVIEWMERRDNYFALSLLLTHKRIAKQCMEEFLQTCEFFDGNFWITNLNQPSEEEIQTWVQTNREDYQRNLLQHLNPDPDETPNTEEQNEQD